MITEDRKQEIVRAFQVSFKRDNSSEIKEFTLSDLRDVDSMLGNRDLNEGYRKKLLYRIKEIEEVNALKHASHIRAVQIIVTFCLGVLVTVVGFYLTK